MVDSPPPAPIRHAANRFFARIENFFLRSSYRRKTLQKPCYSVEMRGKTPCKNHFPAKIFGTGCFFMLRRHNCGPDTEHARLVRIERGTHEHTCQTSAKPRFALDPVEAISRLFLSRGTPPPSRRALHSDEATMSTTTLIFGGGGWIPWLPHLRGGIPAVATATA